MDRVHISGLLQQAMREYYREGLERDREIALHTYLALYLRSEHVPITQWHIDQCEQEHYQVVRSNPVFAPVWSDFYADRIIELLGEV